MRKWIPGAAAVAVVLATACAAHGPVDRAAERATLERRQTEFFAALAARDADGTAELFSDAAVMQVAGMPPIVGRMAIRRFYANMFGFLSASRATPEATHVSGSGDLAYTLGRSSNEFRGPDGPVEYAGKYLLVWEKLAGDWMIVAYSISSNQEANR